MDQRRIVQWQTAVATSAVWMFVLLVLGVLSSVVDKPDPYFKARLGSLQRTPYRELRLWRVGQSQSPEVYSSGAPGLAAFQDIVQRCELRLFYTRRAGSSPAVVKGSLHLLGRPPFDIAIYLDDDGTAYISFTEQFDAGQNCIAHASSRELAHWLQREGLCTNKAFSDAVNRALQARRWPKNEHG
jgi:hypothetical protein